MDPESSPTPEISPSEKLNNLSKSFKEGDLDFYQYLQGVIAVDQSDSIHTQTMSIWEHLTNPEIRDKILSSPPIKRGNDEDSLSESADNTNGAEEDSEDEVLIYPDTEYFLALGLSSIHCMQHLIITEGKVQEGIKFFTENEYLEKIRANYVNLGFVREVFYNDGTIAYLKGDLASLEKIILSYEKNISDSSEEINNQEEEVNLEVLKRLANGLKTRGKIDYPFDYAGMKSNSPPVFE